MLSTIIILIKIYYLMYTINIKFYADFQRPNIRGPNKPYRKKPWDRGKSKICRYYFLAPPKFFHNFVSFHPILMCLTILESGDKTNNIGDEFKTIRLILINT
jgi:hypothetical protein